MSRQHKVTATAAAGSGLLWARDFPLDFEGGVWCNLDDKIKQKSTHAQIRTPTNRTNEVSSFMFPFPYVVKNILLFTLFFLYCVISLTNYLIYIIRYRFLLSGWGDDPFAIHTIYQNKKSPPTLWKRTIQFQLSI